MKKGRPKAFVLMPFGEGFDEIYSLFIADTLTQAGYDVSRADNIRSQQNIIKDIVIGIATSELIVADLTDSNPNVYYELGIAHALRKPVVLLTQEIDDLPFDLRSYRVIPYKTHFAEVSKARVQLHDVAQGFLNDEVPFGSPIIDYLTVTSIPSMELRQTKEEAGEPGFLDHMVALEEGIEELTKFVTSFNDQTRIISESTTEITERINILVKGQDRSTARQMQSLVIGLAEKLSSYGKFLATLNGNYTKCLVQTRTALDSVVRAQNPKTNEEKEQLRIYLTTLTSTEESTRGTRAAVTNLVEVIKSTPSLERTYNRARDRVAQELDKFADNIEQTVSMISRARQIIETKLSA